MLPCATVYWLFDSHSVLDLLGKDYRGLDITILSIWRLALVDRRPSDRSEFRPRLDQERRHRGGNQERDRDAGKDQLVALRAVVNRAGDEGAEDGAPGVEEIHVAADRAEGFAAEEVAHRGPEDRYRCVEHAVEPGKKPQRPE